MLSSTLLTASRQRLHTGPEQSLSESAYRLLKDKIITLDIRPASWINESALMAELEIGRTPLREALQRLAHESLVIIHPRRGIQVADLNMSDLQKIFELRLELESYAARQAALRATPDQLAAMESLFANADDIIRRGDHRQLIALDHRAHQLIARATQNEFLEEALERLYNHVLRLWYVSLHRVSRLREAIEEHRDLIAALKAGDGDRAAGIMRAHIQGFQAQLLAAG